MNSSANLNNIAIMGGGVSVVNRNTPKQYKDKKKQYYEDESLIFNREYAQYAADYVDARVQGLNPDNFEEWSQQLVRLADASSLVASATKLVDDCKLILFANPAIAYVPQGAKVQTMGSTWLVTNPQNISDSGNTAIVERCRAEWRHLDYYGNILAEPIVIEKSAAKAVDNDSQEYVLITEGYYNAKAQYNKYTAELGQNSRIMLGSKVYAVRGFTDFIQEFTGDYDSVRLCEFALYYEEPNDQIDDIENHIAGGKTFSWGISIPEIPSLNIGQSYQCSVKSMRCGDVITSTDKFPISYKWSSSNTEIANVDANGVITGTGAGTCEIAVALEQNSAIKASVNVTVVESAGNTEVAFTSSIPDKLSIYETAEISAGYFENGELADDTIQWEFTGAESSAYSANIIGNSVQITCWGASVNPLVITAKYKEYSASVEIQLYGV